MTIKKEFLWFLASLVLVTLVLFLFPNLIGGGSKTYSNQSTNAEAGNFDSLQNKHGLWEGFYKNNKKSYSGNYANGQKEGEWKHFDYDGKMARIEHYKNGLLNGEMLSYDNDKLYDLITYVNGKREGMHIHYNKTGEINYSQEYRNDSMNGKFEIYSLQGIIQQQGELRNGRNVGEWRNYNQEGVLEEINIYDSLQPSTYRVIKIGPRNDTLSDTYINN